MLGKLVECKTTGFSGIATGVFATITGEVSYKVEPSSGETRWIEKQRLEIVQNEVEEKVVDKQEA